MLSTICQNPSENHHEYISIVIGGQNLCPRPTHYENPQSTKKNTSHYKLKFEQAIDKVNITHATIKHTYNMGLGSCNIPN